MASCTPLLSILQVRMEITWGKHKGKVWEDV